MGRPASCDCDECSKCKRKLYMRVWSAANRQKTRDFARTSYRRKQDTDPEWREKERARNRKRKPKSVTTPEKTRARSVISNALRDGKIMKPVRCTKCGSGDKIQAHHTDYSKPLEVKWVCSTCHGLEHRG